MVYEPFPLTFNDTAHFMSWMNDRVETAVVAVLRRSGMLPPDEITKAAYDTVHKAMTSEGPVDEVRLNTAIRFLEIQRGEK